MQYAQDYDETYPPAYCVNPAVYWPQLLQPYVKSSQVTTCPSDKDIWLPWAGWGVSYILNYRMHPPLDSATGVGIRLVAVARPTETLTLTDNADGSTGNLLPDCQYAWGTTGAAASTGYNPWARVSARHNEGANCGFADGHAKWLQKQELQRESTYWYIN